MEDDMLQSEDNARHRSEPAAPTQPEAIPLPRFRQDLNIQTGNLHERAVESPETTRSEPNVRFDDSPSTLRRRPTFKTVEDYDELESYSARPGWQPGSEPGFDPELPDGGHASMPMLSADCKITVVDFSTNHMVKRHFHNADFIEFLNEPQAPWAKCRWINVNGLSWDVIQAIGNKKDLHRLALEDIMNIRNRTKTDWYQNHAFIILTLQKLVHLVDPDDDTSTSSTPSTWAMPGLRDSIGEFWRGKRQGNMDPEQIKAANGTNSTKTNSLGLQETDMVRSLQRYHASGNEARAEYMESHSSLAAYKMAVSAEQVSLFLTSDNTVISFFEGSAGDVERPIVTRLSTPGTILRESYDGSLLVQAIIDAIIDLAMPLTAVYTDMIGDIELDVLTAPSISQSRGLYICTSEINKLLSFLNPIDNVVNVLRDHVTNLTQDEAMRELNNPRSGVIVTPMTHTYLGDVLDHCIIITENLQQLKQSSDNLIDLIFNTISATQNESLKQLTVVTIIFLPMTFITGFFGQNFDPEGFPEIHNGIWYFWACAVPTAFATIVIVMRDVIYTWFVRLFQRRHIIDVRKRRKRHNRVTPSFIMSHIKQDPDAEREDEIQYGLVGMTKEELDAKYPNRPRNHSRTLRFADLFIELFNPLNENKKQPAGGPARKKGPHGAHKLSPQEQRRHIIERFVTRWRKEVGNDFYPALRLILPDKDRDRGVYGLKENAIGKLLVKLMKIDRNSEDGYNLLHWKLPGQTAASRLAGDFAGRCFEVISKRPMRTTVGDMTIAEVNEQLDRLAASAGEAENLRVLEVFYNRMNAQELMWIIRIILRQMKVGATEKTLLDIWHPDAEALFSVSSSLQRVCWELWDPSLRLEQEHAGVTLMQCFQPQLAQFQMPASFQKMIDLLHPTEEDPEFWIEEKLDGERMQMHMIEDPAHPGGRRFCFWSRKAKDYTYLYGNGLQDDRSSLTRHLKNAFAPGVRNLILDGEMITWDMGLDKIVPFGTLKTAALAEQQNRSSSNSSGQRPLFRVFDILYLNDKQLTQYTLRDRHRALEKAIKPVHRRLEVHQYEAAKTADAIEPLLREVVANASEGLVLKNPRSMYRLNSRNDDWLKVKPEYMTEFGESLDCVVIGGYYGSGKRGGILSSYMCGLRVSQNHIKAGAHPEKCFSFCKVGGGFRAEDYAEIKHRTEGKWMDWDQKNPPSQFIELAGGEARQFEKPDVWIRAKDSVVLSIKAASVGTSDQFALGFTLRFPRFRALRLDRSWETALSIEEFRELKQKVDEESHEKAMTVEDRKRRNPKRVKRELVIAGEDAVPVEFEGEKTKVFDGLEFCILSESLKPFKKTKGQLEMIVKENGGTVTQRPVPGTNMMIVADKKVVKVASLMKEGDVDIIRPKWIQDCLDQSQEGYLLPYEDRHLFHATDAMRAVALQNSDKYGDSFARNVDVEELREIMAHMPKIEDGTAFSKLDFLEQLESHGKGLSHLRGFMFQRCVVYFHCTDGVGRTRMSRLENYVRYAGGLCRSDADDESLTHVVVVGDDPVQMSEAGGALHKQFSSRRKMPRVIKGTWIEDSWKEKTLLDEDRYTV
ncbi:hypothetical protein B0I35DRAFT_483394 [Stachybotrys elegans]|uniref:DNA ligase n=1 Tax=Stachybotrys elegans TaxID=80388 RepID=A0A8K0SH97_9HYPO|nr:hypothetical protein B0I35DRAFT_483394 [Stachybotrys elegans]